MLDLAVLIAVALNQLQVAVLAAGPLDLGLLDEHVATTLPARSDGNTTCTGLVLPQQQPTLTKPKTGAHPRSHSRSGRTTAPQPRKMGLALLRRSDVSP